MAAKVDKDTCIGCGICIDACPVEAIKIDDVAKVDTGECISCSACVDECPMGAISIEA